MAAQPDRLLLYIVPSQRDLEKLSEEVKEEFSFGFRLALEGKKHPKAKTFKGFGGNSVLELVGNDRGGTYRAVYTVRFPKAVYVLHVFQKKE